MDQHACSSGGIYSRRVCVVQDKEDEDGQGEEEGAKDEVEPRFVELENMSVWGDSSLYARPASTEFTIQGASRVLSLLSA